MATRKVTFTLDEQTLRELKAAAERLHKPKSAVVREAIADYHQRIGRLSEAERVEWLRRFDEFIPKIPRRPQSEVDRELAEIRRARRAGGRLHRSER